MLYRIKTKDGYYYNVSGRYGRFTGGKAQAWLHCEDCTKEIIDFLNDELPEVKAQREAVGKGGECNRCSRV